MDISPPKGSSDTRLDALTAWIGNIEQVAGCLPVVASSDASFRRYFRLQNGRNSFIAMDAPPPTEDCLPFIRVAGYLEAMKLNAPRVVEANVADGFLLLTDLGSEQYLDALHADARIADALYDDAIGALLTLQRRGVAFQSLLPSYDEELLRFELSLFRDWLCGTQLGLVFSATDEADWQTSCDLLVQNALDQPQVFVHRDYHARNLMLTEKANPGILDFQDAVEGPVTYDLVSLLKDCYIRWPADRVRGWALQFYRQLPKSTRSQVDERQFRRNFELMGVQRHLKAAGIFCRLCQRDGKTGYLDDIPRTLEYVSELGPEYDELQFLGRLIDERILPSWEVRQ